MNYKFILRWDKDFGLYRIIKFTGKEQRYDEKNKPYHWQLTFGIHPNLRCYIDRNQYDKVVYCFLGLRIHFKRSYSGRFV